MEQITDEAGVSYEELAELEKDFDDVDTEIMRKHYLMTTSLYVKRQSLVSQLPNFWALVLEQAPPDIDQFIQPSDAAILASSLKDIEVARFEISPGPTSNAPDQGSPKSVSFKFTFAPNEWFQDDVLEKKFWFRRASDGWSGLVSEPVKINWKQGKDITEGLLDAAVRLWEAEKKIPTDTNDKSKKGEKKRKTLLEHDALVKKISSTTQGSLSFFAWFGFRGRNISAEESILAVKEEELRRQEIKNGGKMAARPDVEDSNEDDDVAEEDREVFPGGEELAISISEDLWPGALKYFTQAQEQDELSEADFEDDDDDEGEEMDVRKLRELVATRGSDQDDSEEEKPKKKQKT
ncbi:MAG: hypothetical protein M1827_000381 [Pycnora praestabilis]|nr:MAG: hypothetical protein M1827_000381 [Pycnora praestabilis]